MQDQQRRLHLLRAGGRRVIDPVERDTGGELCPDAGEVEHRLAAEAIAHGAQLLPLGAGMGGQFGQRALHPFGQKGAVVLHPGHQAGRLFAILGQGAAGIIVDAKRDIALRGQPVAGGAFGVRQPHEGRRDKDTRRRAIAIGQGQVADAFRAVAHVGVIGALRHRDLPRPGRVMRAESDRDAARGQCRCSLAVLRTDCVSTAMAGAMRRDTCQ